MVDYFKTLVNYSNTQKIKDLVQKGVFATANTTTDIDTSEVKKETYIFKNMVIEPRTDGVLLSGSLHKLHSQLNNLATPNNVTKYGGFNGYTFTLDKITESINALCEVLDVCPSVCVLQNIEIGLNNRITFDPKQFLNGILFHRNNFDYTVKHNGNYVQFDHSEYYLKLYNKGKQYEMPYEVIRVEVKVVKMRKLHAQGIELYTLNDINETTLRQAFEVLYSEFSELVYYDLTTRTDQMKEKDKAYTLRLQNKAYWKSLTRKQKKKERDKLQKMIMEFSDNLKGQIQSKMHDELREILEGQKTQKGYKFTDPQKTKKGTNSPFKYRVKTCPTSLFEIPLTEEEKEYLKKSDLEDEKYNKFCPITGVSLRHEKEGAKYIRSESFLWLKKHNPERYVFLCSLLLPNTGYMPRREKTKLSQLCKQVRNRYHSMKKANEKKSITKPR